MKEILSAQRQHWEKTLIQNPDMFGTEPGDPAQFAVKLFRPESKTRILELGGGQVAHLDFARHAAYTEWSRRDRSFF